MAYDGKRSEPHPPDVKAKMKYAKMGIIPETDRAKYVHLLSLGFNNQEACRAISRNYASVLQTRHAYPEFESAVQEAKQRATVDKVETSLVTLATGYEVTIETFVPILDANKNPVIGPDGNCVMRLAKKVVRRPAPSLRAQQTYLQANCFKYKAAMPEKKDSIPVELSVDPDELEKIINDRADKLIDPSKSPPGV